MSLSAPSAHSCRSCGSRIRYGGRGRRPTTCSPACKRALRADDVRVHRDARREPRAAATPPVSPETRALVARVRQQLRDQAAARTATDDDDGLMGVVARRPSGRLGASTPADVLVSAFADQGGDPPPFGVVRLGSGGDVYASDARRKPRAADSAAAWLAEHHPAELLDFPAQV